MYVSECVDMQGGAMFVCLDVAISVATIVVIFHEEWCITKP